MIIRTWWANKRQEFIKDKLSTDGYLNRADLMEEFNISSPCASRDISIFKNAHPELIEYNVTTKRYESKQ